MLTSAHSTRLRLLAKGITHVTEATFRSHAASSDAANKLQHSPLREVPKEYAYGRKTPWKGQSWIQSQFFWSRDIPPVGLCTGGQGHHLTQTLLRAMVRSQESCGESRLHRNEHSQQHRAYNATTWESHSHQIVKQSKVCFQFTSSTSQQALVTCG